MATTVQDALRAVNAYPVPLRTIIGVAEGRGLRLTDEATERVIKGRQYRLAKADLLLWLALAPNVSQGGQNYSFSDEQRKELKRMAQTIYDELAPDETLAKPIYGYKGSKL